MKQNQNGQQKQTIYPYADCEWLRIFFQMKKIIYTLTIVTIWKIATLTNEISSRPHENIK